MAIYDERDHSPSFVQSGSLVNYAGAAVSLALVVGVSVWGYQLIMRDVSGIPVVRAVEGAMRVAPQAPGGEIATHAGLSVNDVAGVGEAAGPSDSLLLAPATTDLAEEDLRVEPLAEADEVVPAADVVTEQQIPTALETAISSDNAGPLTTEGILALADQIAGTAAPLTALAEGEDVAPTVSVDGEVVATVETIDPSVPGVSESLRPTIRPARATAVSAPAPAAPVLTVTQPAPAPITQVADTSTAVAAALAEATIATNGTLPVGTNLVQLGAYPSAENAASEWTRLSGLFADYMGGKDRVIQEATSGGSTFYRLRASGFAEAADARRFCATLQAANTDCIPVVVR